ncbi:unnamed protein product, partial [Meganyctiphanes norvegica]
MSIEVMHVAEDISVLPYISLFHKVILSAANYNQITRSDSQSYNEKNCLHCAIIMKGPPMIICGLHYNLTMKTKIIRYSFPKLSYPRVKSSKRHRYFPKTRGSAMRHVGTLFDCEKEVARMVMEKKTYVRPANYYDSSSYLQFEGTIMAIIYKLFSLFSRMPFVGVEMYDALKAELVELSIKLATIAQRDMFAENQATVIRDSCLKLANMADKIIQEYSDPLIIQPASLLVATVKKKTDEELGVILSTSYHGVHQISGVRALSPAHQCGKLQEGDEIVQVNYQIVVGWALPKVTALMQENPIEVLLTLKKRPRHANSLSQIYFKPFRLPSKKRTYSPWGSSAVNSPIQSIPNLQLIKSFDKVIIKPIAHTEPPVYKSPTPPPILDITTSTVSPSPPHSEEVNETLSSPEEDFSSDLEDDPFMSESELGGSPLSVRLYHPKPRSSVQRRATIPGATVRPTLSFQQLLQDVRRSQLGTSTGVNDTSLPNADFFRSSNEERIKRPNTCIGTEKRPLSDDKEHTKIENIQEEEEKVKNDKDVFNELNTSESCFQKKVNHSDKNCSIKIADTEITVDKNQENKIVKNVIPLPPRKPTTYNTVSSVNNSTYPSTTPKKISEDSSLSAAVKIKMGVSSPEIKRHVQERTRKFSEDRPKLDKSHSTPAYDESAYDESESNDILIIRSAKEGSPDMCNSSVSRSSSNASSVAAPSPTFREKINKFEAKIIIGNRRISCRELGPGDQQGWLHRRRDSKGFLLSHRWERRWFILKKNYLYGYRDKEAIRADSLIFLPGFHVCPASDVKSKKFAFKIYHTSGATFYFACDTSEERSRWMSQMGLSAISTAIPQKQPRSNGGDKDGYFSETDDELDDRQISPSHSGKQSIRISPGKESSMSSLWRGSSGSPSRGSAPSRTSPLGSLGSSLGSLGTTKAQRLAFLQTPKEPQQPVPTASFRSYRRVAEGSKRSTSTSDLRAAPKSPEASDNTCGTVRVTRKNSLRDRIRQFPASFTLDRRRQPRRSTTNDSCTSSSPINAQPINVGCSKINSTAVSDQQDLEQQGSNTRSRRGSLDSGPRQMPNYMKPTRASTQHSPARPASTDLDTRNSPTRTAGGCWTSTPPPTGRCSPPKFDLQCRRGSIGGDSPVRSLSPRRGSLDCLANSPPQALSPPISPSHTPTRGSSTHGSASSLAASEEYREGSPEKLWINSLRVDPSRSRTTLPSSVSPNSINRVSPDRRDTSRTRKGSGDLGGISERLKRTALYHPPQLRNRSQDSMKAAFEMALDPSATNAQTNTTRHSSPSPRPVASSSPRPQRRLPSSSVRPEVPPRTKFLSASERTLPNSSSTSSLPSTTPPKVPTLRNNISSPSLHHSSVVSNLPNRQNQNNGVNISHYGSVGVPSTVAMTTRRQNHPPNLKLGLTQEEEPPRTPLKPTMGVAMIGKQRRTPSVLSPREVFFASPPNSPTTPFSPSAMVQSLISPSSSRAPMLPGPNPIAMGTSTENKHKEKILPHYPGMEYPPVFEAGSYSLSEPTYSTLGSQDSSLSECSSIYSSGCSHRSSPHHHYSSPQQPVYSSPELFSRQSDYSTHGGYVNVPSQQQSGIPPRYNKPLGSPKLEIPGPPTQPPPPQ